MKHLARWPSPFQPPDWRARHCEYLIDRGKCPLRRVDDPITQEAWKFFSALRRAHCDRQQDRVRRRWPHFAAAVQLRKDTDVFCRWVLEARILAREPIASVAERLGLAPEAVESYVALYFDILGALDATDYIVLQVIGFSPSRDCKEQDVEVWLKLFGYFAGSSVLDSLLDFYRDPELIPADLTLVEPARRARVKLHLTIRGAILTECLPVSDAHTLTLQCLVDRMVAVRRDVSGGFSAIQLSPGKLEGLLRTTTDKYDVLERVAG